MPGLIGLVGSCADRKNIVSAAESVMHFDRYRSQCLSPFEGLQVAQVWRSEGEVAGSWARDKPSGVSVFVNGTIIQSDSTPQSMRAEHILRKYLNGTLKPEDYDCASFLIAVSDPRSKQLIVWNDRLGTLPCYYYSGADCFCFGPEAKAIFASIRMVPQYSANGLVSFLTLGYCLASTTLFESIRYLEPGSRLIVDVPAVKYKVTRYWQIQYQRASRFQSRHRAEEALYEAVASGHRSVIAGSDEKYDLLLSGGWDSRGMLGFASALGRKPLRSISWGLRDDVPSSDPFLAAQLARYYNLTHHFVAYDTDSFTENAAEWSYLTELSNDNFGWYGEGTHVLVNDYASDADYMLIGDECWGYGNHVRNREEAMAACHMPGITSRVLGKCLSAALSADAPAIYSSEIDKTLSPCVNADPDDQKDFLYLHGRVARFIFSLGYFKEFAVEIRRPFFSKEVLEIIQQVPPKFRYRKNLYISMLIRFFPELLKFNECTANSLPQWKYDLLKKKKLSAYFAGLLSPAVLAQTAFAAHLNLDGVEDIRAQFFATEPRNERPKQHRRVPNGKTVQLIKQHIAAYDNLALRSRLKDPPSRVLHSFDILRRLALLVLLDRSLRRVSDK